jgi:peptide methionine sulfoxide reductase msrA/msrB
MSAYISVLLTVAFILAAMTGCSQDKKKANMQFSKLTPEEEQVIIHKGTERPFTGKYENFWEAGTYVCKRCGAALYTSTSKFDAGCGWPSFDDEIEGAVKRIPDPDGMRTEIICANCEGHLGHVFLGEGFTPKNTRHCVNSVSLEFIPAGQEKLTDKAIFAGGCFWGVEYYLQKVKGVISVESGYIGGNKDNPTYEEVCTGKTGHYEAVEVVFQPALVSFEELAKLFFEIHDPTQWNHQGPDWGVQYRSAVFYLSDEQKEVTEKLIGQLKKNGYNVVTEVRPATVFWKAEQYHQDYYFNKGSEPYCHGYVKRF